MYEMELMDHMIEHEDGEIINLIFDEPIRLPTPEELTTDEQAEGPLKVVLTRLALFGIALDVCEHYTPRMAYRYLVETMLPNERAYPQMRQTQWVQHFSTSDDCPDCQKEFELPEESD